MAGKVRRMGAAHGGSLISDAKLQQLFATMMQCRLLTEFAQRRRSPGSYSASLGQEAIATGCVIDLQPGDTIALARRDSIASLVKGVPLSDLVAQLHGRRKPAPNILPGSSSSSQLSAVLAKALANRKQKNNHVVIAFTHKATSTRKSWHEALASAAKRTLPIIFVVENNPWVVKENPVAKTQKQYGFPIFTVDGNDVVAVYRVAYESLERVRQGGGPVLVEGKTYRLQAERDPLTHMESYLRSKGLFTARWKNQIVGEFSRQLDAAIAAAQAGRK